MLIKRIDKKNAEVKMYGNIGGWFVDGFNFTSILDELESDGVVECTFRVHCFGGSVFEGNVIGGAFARSKMKIKLVIDGIAASMMAMILPYVAVENIQIADAGFGMIHRPSAGSAGDAGDHLSTAKLLLDIEGYFIRTLAERTGKPADEIKTLFFDGKDHWLTADEMVSYKLAGSKIKSIASIAELDKQIVANMTEENVYNHFAAKLDTEGNIPNNKKINFKMKEDLIKAFGLSGVTAESSDTAVLAALQAKFKANEDRLDTLEAEAKTKKAAAIKAALDIAKISAELRPTYEAIGDASGIEVLNTILAGLNVKAPIISHLKAEGKGGLAGSKETGVKTWAWYQEHDVKTLEAMPVSDPEAFKALYASEFGCDPTV